MGSSSLNREIVVTKVTRQKGRVFWLEQPKSTSVWDPGRGRTRGGVFGLRSVCPGEETRVPGAVGTLPGERISGLKVKHPVTRFKDSKLSKFCEGNGR